MLVLALKRDEAIICNNGEIVFRLLEIRGRIVRVGITAPQAVPVNREEVQNKIDAKVEQVRTRASGAELGDSPAAPCVPSDDQRLRDILRRPLSHDDAAPGLDGG